MIEPERKWRPSGWSDCPPFGIVLQVARTNLSRAAAEGIAFGYNSSVLQDGSIRTCGWAVLIDSRQEVVAGERVAPGPAVYAPMPKHVKKT